MLQPIYIYGKRFVLKSDLERFLPMYLNYFALLYRKFGSCGLCAGLHFHASMLMSELPTSQSCTICFINCKRHESAFFIQFQFCLQMVDFSDWYTAYRNLAIRYSWSDKVSRTHSVITHEDTHFLSRLARRYLNDTYIYCTSEVLQ